MQHAKARSNPLEPSPCINTMVSPNFFETKFNKVIEGLGKFKLKKKESNLLMTFFLIKLQCKLPRFEYETIIVGDEYDEEDTARENAFAKAYSLLWNKFRQEMMTLEKAQNTYFPPRQGVMQYF
ncbi:unnamed protein product [Orchesella dallaii]|uniref:Uncharacterized protein n=1 Tax=Orchesella dallaii TaxID=48710 RepID=A0ABP1QDM5_9HEXA